MHRAIEITKTNDLRVHYDQGLNSPPNSRTQEETFRIYIFSVCATSLPLPFIRLSSLSPGYRAVIMTFP